MAKLKAARRRKIPKSQFGLPGSRRFPVHDRAHAVAAKGRATQQYRKGKLSKASKDKVHARANKVLARKTRKGKR